MKLITIRLQDVPTFTQYALIGWYMSRIEPGERARFHIFDRTDAAGNEVPASPYGRESFEATMRDLAIREDSSLIIERDGLALVVKRPL